MIMLKCLRALRTNENILIAADVLLSSKSSFMNVFLMAFMINISAASSPVNFIVYCIVRYSLMALFAIILIPLFKKHTLASWRISMMFSIFEILAVVLLDSQAFYFPYVLAIFSAAESSLYWRPKMYFDVTEVPDSRRLYFKGRATIFTEVIKIVMPVVLGIVIGNAGYTRAAFIILGISLAQLLLSLCFRPTAKHQNTKVHAPLKVYEKVMAHESLRKIYLLQFVRGFVISSSALLVIAQINLYRSTNSDLDLGIFTSLPAIIAIVAVLLYRRIKNASRQKAFLCFFVPAIILLPVALIIAPHHTVLSVTLYVFMQSIAGGLFDGTITQTRLQGIISTHLKDDSYRIEIECSGEVALTIGRVLGLTILLFLILMGLEEYMIWLALIESFFIVAWLEMALPKKHHYN